MSMTLLPIEPVLPELGAALAAGNAVLVAPPGAGKTTRVPLALLEADWLAGRRIVMLEPRRLAARLAARRMAALLGEQVGETVGHRVRLDSRIGPRTRLEVVTEGVLLRMVQDDPTLETIGCVILDEFHERSLEADLGLALLREVQGALRPDLRLLVMSATLDGAPVASLLGNAPVIASEGRAFPVATRWLDRPAGPDPVAACVALLHRALAETAGDVLVFLPGESEIRRAERLLAPQLSPDLLLAPLYGALTAEAQERAVAPAPPGRRKIVLASAIAETSLTIEGVRVVVDSGLARRPRFDPGRGMTRLETLRVSRAEADQRRGRAGRLGPGQCYRLWTEAEERALAPFARPEILSADLAPLALELACWGADPARLAWLDPPPAAALAQARDLLAQLGALDHAGRPTAHGRAMAALGAHPRLAHMMLRGREIGLGALACDLAALLAERDVVTAAAGMRARDLGLRLDLLHDPAAPLPPGMAPDRGALRRAKAAAAQWRRRLGLSAAPAPRSIDAGRLVMLAYPDRIAQRRGAAGLFRLRNGRGAALPAEDPLAACDWLAVADLDAGTGDGRIFLAAPVSLAEIVDDCAAEIERAAFVAWDMRAEAVVARLQERLGALVLGDGPLHDPPPDQVMAALLAGIRRLGIERLPWTPELRQFQARVLFLRRIEGAEIWPDLSDAALLARLEDWLAPFLGGITRASQFGRIDLAAALGSLLSWEQKRRLDAEAPRHLRVPSGTLRPLDYLSGPEPVLAVKLQEMFGARETPRIAGGRVALLLHLLSPAGRPVQVTRDLESFWAEGYAAVKRDLKGRYPKHPWPDDPLLAEPSARTKRRAG